MKCQDCYCVVTQDEADRAQGIYAGAETRCVTCAMAMRGAKYEIQQDNAGWVVVRNGDDGTRRAVQHCRTRDDAASAMAEWSGGRRK